MDEMAIEPELCTCEPADVDLGFCELYDSYWCKVCGCWLEVNCGDPACEICTTRPDRHPQVHHQGDL